MDTPLPILYLLILLVLLSGAAWFIFRQIFKTRKVESTLSRLQKKLRDEKGTSQEYYELGCIYLDKKLFSQAVVILQKALKAPDLEGEENIALVYNALGYAYAAQEQYDLAIRQYKEALKNKPQYVTALNNLGFAYERKKLMAPALECYEEVLLSEPDNPTAKKRAQSLRRQVVPST
ncbi:tetratricopeptide repeat protein [Ancylothrix sp. C2]|uniref:tetratricopeptide repeat protein n=1 Tax=Ancylothrix sp. D3o TaxID=2953691 RepID=UPI0021BAE68C|nr:tetratricopeptide repeat protein [Ancylothrix sp. D3o]MCT7951011.1 tetratricopeptide repeat protein [Ancylothrix sp. D3o]